MKCTTYMKLIMSSRPLNYLFISDLAEFWQNVSTWNKCKMVSLHWHGRWM